MKSSVMHEYKGLFIEPASFDKSVLISDYREFQARYMGREKKWNTDYTKVTSFRNGQSAHKVVDTL